jgi:hypothetical protein
MLTRKQLDHDAETLRCGGTPDSIETIVAMARRMIDVRDAYLATLEEGARLTLAAADFCEPDMHGNNERVRRAYADRVLSVREAEARLTAALTALLDEEVSR